MYQQIQDTLLTGIKKFADVIPDVDHYFVPELTKRPKPPLPFFTFHNYDEYNRITFNDVESEPWTMKYQFKSHADDENTAKDMAFSLHKLLQSQQFLYDMAQKGIGINRVDTMPPLNEPFVTRFEFVSGVELELLINDNWQDPTQSGDIDSVGFNLQTKEEGN